MANADRVTGAIQYLKLPNKKYSVINNGIENLKKKNFRNYLYNLSPEKFRKLELEKARDCFNKAANVYRNYIKIIEAYNKVLNKLKKAIFIGKNLENNLLKKKKARVTAKKLFNISQEFVHIFTEKARNNILSDILILKKKRFTKLSDPFILTDSINLTFND